MNWLEELLAEHDEVEIPSLESPHRDRECIGKVLSISRAYVIFETSTGERIKWGKGKLYKLPLMEYASR